jgi:hypothetical protein
MLSPPQLGDGAPGWWDTPTKKAALTAFNTESDPVKRGALWGRCSKPFTPRCLHQRRQVQRPVGAQPGAGGYTRPPGRSSGTLALNDAHPQSPLAARCFAHPHRGHRQ